MSWTPVIPEKPARVLGIISHLLDQSATLIAGPLEQALPAKVDT